MLETAPPLVIFLTGPLSKGMAKSIFKPWTWFGCDHPPADVTNLADEFRRYELEPQTITVNPTDVDVNTGRLQIVTENQEHPKVGVKTRVYLDGREVKKCAGIELRIYPDEVVEATLKVWA